MDPIANLYWQSRRQHGRCAIAVYLDGKEYGQACATEGELLASLEGLQKKITEHINNR